MSGLVGCVKDCPDWSRVVSGLVGCVKDCPDWSRVVSGLVGCEWVGWWVGCVIGLVGWL